MENKRRNDIVYGQNWIDQGMYYRRRYGFVPFFRSNFDSLTGMLGRMAEGPEGRIYSRRQRDFGEGNWLQNYFIVR